ncbi:MAG: glycosyltransferase family protein [Candidatus Nanoarchaeia archaeon]
MKILYGIQSTGNGHIIRAKEMIPALRKLGCEVETILSGDTEKKIINSEIFEPSQRKRGLTFVTESGKIKYLQTIKELNLVKFYTDIFSYEPKGVDLIITDYEPITARIAKRYKIPSIGIGHLYAFYYDVPVTDKNLIGNLVMKQFAPVDIPLGLHWHHYNQPILPPTIPPDVKPAKKVIENKILVYLPFEDISSIKKHLKNIKEYDFYVYCNINKAKDEGNLHLRPFSRKNFVKDLGECIGIICNSGFSLLSEALHLGKKILTKPVEKQVEQESNALALEQLNLGTVSKNLSEYKVKKWLKLPPPKPMEFPEVIPNLARWIAKGEWDDTEALVKEMWRESLLTIRK